MIKNLYSPYKLLKHLDRLDSWMKSGFCNPITVDFEISDKCNHKCPLCIGSSRNEKRYMVSLEDTTRISSELRETDARGVTLGGVNGDPTCNPNMAHILRSIKNNGMDVAINTNGESLSEKDIEAIAINCTWVRISLDADRPEIYKKTHGMARESFYKVLKNLSSLVSARQTSGSDATINVSYLVGRHTLSGVYNAAKLVKNLGVDAIRFRPFFSTAVKSDLLPSFEQELEKCKDLEDSSFEVSYARDRCDQSTTGEKREYERCYASHFISFIAPDLKVYPCCLLKGQEKHVVGDLNNQSFGEIWNSQKRIKISDTFGLENCPYPCMHENVNEKLHAIKENKSEDIRMRDIIIALSEYIPHSNFL